MACEIKSVQKNSAADTAGIKSGDLLVSLSGNEIVDVLDYGEPKKQSGLSVLNAPGNDLVASCALAASGAQIVLFTTGRGTPFACPVPTVKISSNTNLFEKKSAWIDFNAGVLLDGEDADAVADRFYDFVLQIAEGKIKTKSEKLDKSSFAIWKDGVTL